MKRLLYVTALAILLLGSCNKFLDKSQPTSFIQPSVFYQTQDQVLLGLNAVYAPLTDNGDGGIGGVYNPSANGGDLYGWYLNTVAQQCSDEMGQAFSTFNSVTNLNSNYTDPYSQQFWVTCYVGINRANTLLSTAITYSDTAFVNEVMAEARFMRGYYYFLLVQSYGAVPLRLTPSTYPATSAVLARTSVDSVYAQIYKDMTTAEPHLYQINDGNLGGGSSRISQTAADGILARVCLYMASPRYPNGLGIGDNSQYANAKAWAYKVLASPLHGLTTNADTSANPNIVNLRGTPLAYDRNSNIGYGPAGVNNNPSYHNNGYAQNFIFEAQGKYNTKENMWEADYGYTSSTVLKLGGIGYRFGQDISGTESLIGGGNGNWLPNPYLYAVTYLDSNDLRRDWNICPYQLLTPSALVPTGKQFPYTGANGQTEKAQLSARREGKWRREFQPSTMSPANNGGNQGTAIKFPILRYADVVLMAAEAELQTGDIADALMHINWIRRRAYGWDDYTTPPPVSTDETSPYFKYRYCDIPNAKYPNSDAGSVLTYLQAERSRELCFEDLRVRDLIRWGIYKQQLQNTINYVNQRNGTNGFITDKGSTINAQTNVINLGFTPVLLWPIPQLEVNTNTAITQNPGW